MDNHGCSVIENHVSNGTLAFNYYSTKSTEVLNLPIAPIKPLTKKSWVPVRFVIVFLGIWATGFVFSLRVNLSVAIVAMVNSTMKPEKDIISSDMDEKSSEYCHHDLPYINFNTSLIIEPPRYEKGKLLWTQATQGVVLGAYYYGYATTQVIGGRFAEKYSPRYLCASGIFVSGLATLLTPLGAEHSIIAVVILRMIIGISHGFVYTSLYTMLSSWFPKKERTTALAFITVGGNLGAALTMPLASYLNEFGFEDGWQSVFHVTGGASFIWVVLWTYYIRDTPEEHPKISVNELNHIHSGLDLISKKKVSAPWLKILTSKSVFAVAVAKSCGMFGYYTLSTKLPGYLESVLRMPMQKNGSINSLTYVAVSVTMAFAGPLSDYIKNNYDVQLTTLRKVFETIALSGTAICLALIPTAGCNETFVIWLLIISMFLFGFTTGGDIPIVADIAPQFSGTIFGITNTVSVTMGFIAPVVVGVLLDDNHRSLTQWSYVFYLSAALSLFGNIVFIIWASATPEPWGFPQKIENQRYLNEKKITDASLQTPHPPG